MKCIKKKLIERDIAQFQVNISSTSGVIDCGKMNIKRCLYNVTINVITPPHQYTISSNQLTNHVFSNIHILFSNSLNQPMEKIEELNKKVKDSNIEL